MSQPIEGATRYRFHEAPDRNSTPRALQPRVVVVRETLRWVSDGQVAEFRGETAHTDAAELVAAKMRACAPTEATDAR